MIKISRIEGLTRTMMMMKIMLLLLCEMMKKSDVRTKKCCYLKCLKCHCYHCSCCCCCCCCLVLVLFFHMCRNDLPFDLCLGCEDHFFFVSKSRLSVYQEIYYFLLFSFPFHIQYQLNSHQCCYHCRHHRNQIMM